ncbi:unnamed protein product [Adineta ricciae]|uniref:Uncharacterized protein n=1 Tax=Adineta ricciae TaxID=249248 RepID=A0A814JDP5_ADIRI|nr:unnamed protein product [Adineta ricciae]
MELETSLEEPDEDENEEFPPLPSDIEVPSFTNTPDLYDNRHNPIDFVYCASPPLPSPPTFSPPAPPPPTTSAGTMDRVYANARTISSIRHNGSLTPIPVSFATQHKKKARAPIACSFQSIYVNIPMSPPLPPPPQLSPLHLTPTPVKPVNTSNEVTYATLMNTTSLVPSICPDITLNHVEYQQIQIQHEIVRVNSNRIYENIKARRPPPPPCYSPPPAIPIENNKSPPDQTVNDHDCLPSSLSSTSAGEHIYINLKCQDDQPPAIPTRTCKSIPISTQLSPPPIISRRNEHRKDENCPVVKVPINSIEKDPSGHETSSNASTLQTVKEVEINHNSSENDKNNHTDRTKASTTTAENLPSVTNARQWRALHSIRRRRLRGSVALRSATRLSSNHNVHRQQQSRSNANTTVLHPMMTDDRWRRTLRKRRRQRVVQMKLDGNDLHQQTKSVQPTSDHTYNEIKQPILPTSAIQANGHNGAAAGSVLERAMQFNGALRDRVFSWYRGASNNDRVQQEHQQATPSQIVSTSENGESDQKEIATNGDEEEEEDDQEEEEEEEEQEFFTHDTFEDFLLRRRPKSAASTTASITSTVVSHIDFVPQRAPVRTPPKSKSHPSRTLPPPPALPPPLPPTPPPARRFPGLALSLDKTDVDFIHNILQRTRGDHRVWNRITALKEAYIRATSKKNDQPKKPKPNDAQMDAKKKKKAMLMKHSLAATKIRAELEKYDELPASSATVIDDEDDYDITCSADDHRKMNYNPHHRSAPTILPTPSAAHRVLSFVTSIKRRAQSNVQQLQKNLHDIRSRVHTESSMIPSTHINVQRRVSTVSRQKQNEPPSTTRVRPSRVESTSNANALVRRANSHRSATSTEQSSALHRQQLNRTQSNASQVPQQQRQTYRQHHRITKDKSPVVVDRSASLTTRPPPPERRSSHQIPNKTTSHRQRVKN